ncbi:hypothetical protein C8R45DRAFT_1210457 [Mycena sanguinolenta]|nr:hypothetical protein C8R45DRAFT_1210457 [Mycena sanguinolenta]
MRTGKTRTVSERSPTVPPGTPTPQMKATTKATNEQTKTPAHQNKRRKPEQDQKEGGRTDVFREEDTDSDSDMEIEATQYTEEGKVVEADMRVEAAREETVAAMVERQVDHLAETLRIISDHYAWPEALLDKVRTVAYKFKPEWFCVKTESTSKSTEADSFTKQSDTTTIVKVLEDLAAQVAAMRQRVEGIPSERTGGKSEDNNAQTNRPGEVHATGPVYKPTAKQPKTASQTKITKPKNQLASYHPSRLIVNLRDAPTGAGRLSEREVVQVINTRLSEHEESKHLIVTAARYNNKSSCIIFTREDQTAEELQKHERKFIGDLARGGRATTLLDTPWHKIQIHGMYTGYPEGRILTGEEVWAELCRNSPSLAKMELLHPPRWMQSVGDMEREGQTSSSVVVALKNEEDATALLAWRMVAGFARFCDVKKHMDKPPTQLCPEARETPAYSPDCSAVQLLWLRPTTGLAACTSRHGRRDVLIHHGYWNLTCVSMIIAPTPAIIEVIHDGWGSAKIFFVHKPARPPRRPDSPRISESGQSPHWSLAQYLTRYKTYVDGYRFHSRHHRHPRRVVERQNLFYLQAAAAETATDS